MKIAYTTTTINGKTWFFCTVETREAGFLGYNLRRGVSDAHPTKRLAKKEALARLEIVLP